MKELDGFLVPFSEDSFVHAVYRLHVVRSGAGVCNGLP